ncbi:hypothetical protein PL81_19805 [Streptomyces sp. RSD-27]|nr:hypothetical protein PL81_19805 [Streptomyces sp. RSD-27]
MQKVGRTFKRDTGSRLYLRATDTDELSGSNPFVLGPGEILTRIKELPVTFDLSGVQCRAASILHDRPARRDQLGDVETEVITHDLVLAGLPEIADLRCVSLERFLCSCPHLRGAGASRQVLDSGAVILFPGLPTAGADIFDDVRV